MADNEKRNILIIMLGVILLLLMFIIYLLISNNYQKNKNDDYNKLEVVEDNKEDANEEAVGDTSNDNHDVEKVNIIENNVIEDKSKREENKAIDGFAGNENTNNSIVDNSSNVVYSEETVVNYFESNEQEIKNSSFKDKFKEYFIEIVDFIFYDTEIKGYTFRELTNIGKLKVISVALKIDSYIEEKSPGYKDNIKSSSNRIYTNVKEKLITLFLDISSNICKDREEDCDNAKELFGDIKSTCKIGWSFIKGLLSSGSGKLKEWYEVYRGK